VISIPAVEEVSYRQSRLNAGKQQFLKTGVKWVNLHHREPILRQWSDYREGGAEQPRVLRSNAQ
jgi:hypothetical protein